MKNILKVMTVLILSVQHAFAIESFSKIVIEKNAKIILHQDSVCKIEYPEGKSPDEFTTVKNGILNIGGVVNDVHISLPKLEGITIDGHGSVNGITPFNVDDLSLIINGEGKIDLQVTAKKINGQINGVGKISLKGTAQNAEFSIPGSGKVEAMDLKTVSTIINIDGLGKCSVDAVDRLNANINGNGTVTYRSMPKELIKNITGMGVVKSMNDDNESNSDSPDTTKIELGKKQLWVIGKKDSIRKNGVKPIWAGLELGLNSYLDNGGSFTLGAGKELFDLRLEKSVSVALNFFNADLELGKSNFWLLTGLGITWNNYRFDNNVVIDNGDYIRAHVDSTEGVRHLKSKLTASYLTAPLMFEVFTSRKMKNAFHFGGGMMLGLRIGSHTKQKVEVDGNVSKIKEHDDFNLSPFRYGFRVAVGYGKFNIFADYYATTLFRENKGPILFPVNFGVTLAAF